MVMGYGLSSNLYYYLFILSWSKFECIKSLSQVWTNKLAGLLYFVFNINLVTLSKLYTLMGMALYKNINNDFWKYDKSHSDLLNLSIIVPLNNLEWIYHMWTIENQSLTLIENFTVVSFHIHKYCLQYYPQICWMFLILFKFTHSLTIGSLMLL